MKKVAFIGQQCAGKTTAAMVVYPDSFKTIVKLAQPLYVINRVLDVPKNRGFMQEQADLIKKHFGREFFIDAFDEIVDFHQPLPATVLNDDSRLDLSDYQRDDVLVNDDCRLQLEFNYLKSHGWQTVYIEASEEIRRERAKTLGLEFIADHSSETEVPSLNSQCDLVIVNEGTLEEFKDTVRRGVR